MGKVKETVNENVKEPVKDSFSVVEYCKFFDEVNKIFYEREWEVNQILYAILLNEHVLLKGIPGTGKSMLALKIFNGIQGAEIYKNQFTRMQDDSYIFGPQLLDEFKKGRVVHNVEASLVTANFGFLDEFFNACEETLVATLEILNEKTFTRPHQKEICPLITAIMTTNQERESEKELRAVYDRILFKSEVKEIIDANKRAQMYAAYFAGDIQSSQPKLDFNSLMNLKKEFDNFKPKFSGGMIVIYDTILSEFENQVSVKISPRRKNKLLGLVKASCFLNGGSAIELSDIEAIKFGLIEGGDVKALGYFDAILTKIKQSMKNADVIQKMEVLLEGSKIEQDISKRFKIAVGVAKKCEKMIGESANDVSAAIVIPMLENLKRVADTMADEIKSKGEGTNLFNL